MIIKEKSAGAIIFKRKNEKILYLILKAKLKSEYWEFPKGLIENETIENTVKREISEETGIKNIKIIENFKEKVHYFYKREGKTISKEVIYLLAECLEENVKISYEHIDYEWAEFNEVIKKIKENIKPVLEKAHKYIQEMKKEKTTTLLDFQ